MVREISRARVGGRRERKGARLLLFGSNDKRCEKRCKCRCMLAVSRTLPAYPRRIACRSTQRIFRENMCFHHHNPPTAHD